MTIRTYAVPVESTRWFVPSSGEAVFEWNYGEHRDRLLSLYDKGKKLQWDANTRIDWSHEVDKDDPLKTPDQYNPLFGTDIWERLDERARCEVALHVVAWQFSQFLHGEQGALLCAAKIVQTVPDLDAKFYAATQVMDEARHVEVYARYLNEKLELAYPINPDLKTLLDQVLTDRRWDFTYLGMQILIEGLALAAFGTIRDLATDPLGCQLNAYVMQDEARHVAFGRFALRDYYPELSDAERREREEFVVEACHLMRDRFLAKEVWDHLGLKGATEAVDRSLSMQEFRKMLFSRIVPAIREIGLFGPRVRDTFEKLGVAGFAALDLDALSAADDARARAFDEARAKADAGIAEAVATAEEAGEG